MRDLVKAKIMPQRPCVAAILNLRRDRSIILKIDTDYQTLFIITVIDTGVPALHEIQKVYEVG